MARTLSSDLQTQINLEGVRLAHLLKIEDLGASNTDILVTNHHKDLTYNTESYTAGGSFVDIQEVEETGQLEYTSLSLGLNNVTDAVRNLFIEQNYIGNNVEVYTAFLDADETIIDAYTYFKGSITGANITTSKDGFKVTAEVSSQWKDWDVKKGRRYTTGSQDAFCAKNSLGDDLGLEYAHVIDEDIRWNR